jgi:two-component system response regulator DesR
VIRVLIAEDQGMVRGALKVLLDLEPDIEVVAEAGRGDKVVELARRYTPDVALLDIEMPVMDGLGAAAALHVALPSCVVLILTTFGRPGYLRRAMEAGASGFLVKDGPVEELAAAIRRAVGGERVIDVSLAAAALSAGPNPLTPRERDVLRAAEDGSTIAAIAAHLSLSEGTVRNYLSSAIQKTAARNRTEVQRVAQANGLAVTHVRRVDECPQHDPGDRRRGTPVVVEADSHVPPVTVVFRPEWRAGGPGALASRHVPGGARQGRP